MRYETVRQAAHRIGVDDSRVRRLCISGRWPGAEKVGKAWLIPKGSRPKVGRRGPTPAWAEYEKKVVS